MSILSVDNISPIGSGTSVTINKSVTLESGNTNITGVCTATSFSGGLPITNGADNRVITATSASAIQGEANLTFDGTTFKVQAATPAIEISGTNSNGGNSSLHFNANVNHWVLEADNYTQQNLFSIKSGTTVSSTPRLTINPNGGVGINTSNFSGQLNNEVGLAVHGSSNDNCRISITTPTKSNSRIGYFGLSNRFGIDVHNGFEIRDAEASYATRFKIDNNGYMTAPSQPSFAAYITGMSSESANTGNQIMPFNTTNTNVGGHFKTSGTDQYKFVAPVAGNYYFSLSQNHSARVDTKILKNGVIYHGGESETSNMNWWDHHHLSCVIPLAAGDKVHCETNNQDGSGKRAWNSGYWESFSGFLIG